MFKEKISKTLLTAALVLGVTCTAFANGGEQAAQERAIDPALTNLAAEYPLQANVLPQVPPAPKSIGDTEGITKYVAAVNAYMEAAQKYIDASTNDLNRIAEQRNLAIQNANRIIEEYNAFFEKHKDGK